MTHTPTPEAIEAGTAAYWDNGGKTWGSPSYAEARHNPEYLGRIGEAQRIITAALTAAAPLIAAQAKAEALREAALAMDNIAVNTLVTSRSGVSSTWGNAADWLRARAAIREALGS